MQSTDDQSSKILIKRSQNQQEVRKSPMMAMNREDTQKIRVEKDLDSKLLKYKGAIGVDVDYKQVKDQKTERCGITIYVKKKLPKEELSAEEMIPAEIEGIPTDVVECPNVWPSSEATEQV